MLSSRSIQHCSTQIISLILRKLTHQASSPRSTVSFQHLLSPIKIIFTLQIKNFHHQTKRRTHHSLEIKAATFHVFVILMASSSPNIEINKEFFCFDSCRFLLQNDVIAWSRCALLQFSRIVYSSDWNTQRSHHRRGFETEKMRKAQKIW